MPPKRPLSSTTTTQHPPRKSLAFDPTILQDSSPTSSPNPPRRTTTAASSKPRTLASSRSTAVTAGEENGAGGPTRRRSARLSGDGNETGGASGLASVLKKAEKVLSGRSGGAKVPAKRKAVIEEEDEEMGDDVGEADGLAEDEGEDEDDVVGLVGSQARGGSKGKSKSKAGGEPRASKRPRKNRDSLESVMEEDQDEPLALPAPSHRATKPSSTSSTTAAIGSKAKTKIIGPPTPESEDPDTSFSYTSEPYVPLPHSDNVAMVTGKKKGGVKAGRSNGRTALGKGQPKAVAGSRTAAPSAGATTGRTTRAGTQSKPQTSQPNDVFSSQPTSSSLAPSHRLPASRYQQAGDTSISSLTGTEEVVPLSTAETPMIRRNVAMRKAADTRYEDSSEDEDEDVLKGRGGSGLLRNVDDKARKIRRSSTSKRGKRISSIGGGHEALPHPSIPHRMLYRHINAEDPSPVRFRTLTSWTFQRVKNLAETKLAETEQPKGRTRRGATGEGDELSDAMKEKVKEAMAGFVRDICSKNIDVSWGGAPAAEKDKTAEDLPPHPQNEANQRKLAELSEWSSRLQGEDGVRKAQKQIVYSFQSSISKAVEASSSSSSSTSVVIDTRLPIPEPSSFSTLADVLAYGKSLISSGAANAGKAAEENVVEGKGKRRSMAQPRKEEANDRGVDVEKDLGFGLDQVKEHVSALHQTVHRIDQFARTSSRFVTDHLARSHARLLEINSGGALALSSIQPRSDQQRPSSTASALGGDREQGFGPGAGGLRGLAVGGAPEDVHTGSPGDAMDILRGIAREDSRGR